MNSDFPAPKCNFFAHILGKSIIKLSGWKIKGGVPQSKSMIIIAAPHTTNWDLVYLLGAAYSFRLSIYWLGKSNLFFPIFGSVMRFLGGIPVERSKRNNMVTQLAERINNSEGLSIVVPPAGTRAYTDYWKSGFYRIALEADIPIVCGYLDFPKKEAGLGLSFKLSGNITEDMDKIRAFYSDKVGKYPDSKSEIRLKEEMEQS
ncbi:MAG: 1-acyl-sn-glycerol-3-phosphate acyltransferase [Candidatus Azotimanducaceae bacterium]|jgi:1-acyl-sn-glycerol-3-phosphate acyltransferase